MFQNLILDMMTSEQEVDKGPITTKISVLAVQSLNLVVAESIFKKSAY